MLEALDLDEDGELDGVSHSTLREAKARAGAKKVFWLKPEQSDTGFLVRRATTDEFDRVISSSSHADPKRFSIESRNLARACVLYPDKTGFTELLEEQPGLGLTLAGKILELTGLSRSVDTKKV